MFSWIRESEVWWLLRLSRTNQAVQGERREISQRKPLISILLFSAWKANKNTKKKLDDLDYFFILIIECIGKINGSLENVTMSFSQAQCINRSIMLTKKILFTDNCFDEF